MAKQKRVYVNIPMLEALKKMLIRQDNCPRCEQPLDMHAWFQFTEAGQLVACSNESEVW